MSNPPPPPPNNGWKLSAFVTRTFGFTFRTTTNARWNPVLRQMVYQNSRTIGIGVIPLTAVIAALSLGLIPSSKLEQLGNLIKIYRQNPPSKTTSLSSPPIADETEFAIILSNMGCQEIDLTKAVANLKALEWKDEDGNPLTVEMHMDDAPLTQGQLVTLLEFRESLGNCDLLEQQTLPVLNQKQNNAAMKALLASIDSTLDGDHTGESNPADPETDAWAKGLINRLTTGGPNGSMAGGIAVDFMDTVTVPSFYVAQSKLDSFAALNTDDDVVAIVKDAVDSASQSTAKGLTNFLAGLSEARDDTNKDRQTATMVKGIKDSMPSTGRTVAQLAVFNALRNEKIAKMPQEKQLQVAYTVANTTRAAVEATGAHVADLYQADEIPTAEELQAIGARGLGDFLGSVAKTVANGVMQAAPVILNSVASSIAANNQLGSNLPPSIMLTCVNGVHDLSPASKITLASRIVNGKCNPDANVVTDKAVSDLATRTSELGAQATLDTFNNTALPQLDKNDPATREKFRNVALAISTLSPTLSNVTDIGATNLVTDAALKHSDSLRQNALEVGMRSSANMIADNPSATMLFMVHQHRLKNGREFKPRGFGDFLKSVVPLAANIASTAIPALLSVI
jgi:hypothetical protein